MGTGGHEVRWARALGTRAAGKGGKARSWNVLGAGQGSLEWGPVGSQGPMGGFRAGETESGLPGMEVGHKMSGTCGFHPCVFPSLFFN